MSRTSGDVTEMRLWVTSTGIVTAYHWELIEMVSAASLYRNSRQPSYVTGRSSSGRRFRAASD